MQFQSKQCMPVTTVSTRWQPNSFVLWMDLCVVWRVLLKAYNLLNVTFLMTGEHDGWGDSQKLSRGDLGHQQWRPGSEPWDSVPEGKGPFRVLLQPYTLVFRTTTLLRDRLMYWYMKASSTFTWVFRKIVAFSMRFGLVSTCKHIFRWLKAELLGNSFWDEDFL